MFVFKISFNIFFVDYLSISIIRMISNRSLSIVLALLYNNAWVIVQMLCNIRARHNFSCEIIKYNSPLYFNKLLQSM